MTYSCVYVPSVEGEYKVMYYLHVVLMSSRWRPPPLQLKGVLLRGVASLEEDNSVVFYHLSTSKSGLIRSGLW
jgi:hypothetical protein